MDYQSGKHKGFCFAEFEDADDADEAIFNLDGAELLGRTLRCSMAQPNQVNKLSNQSEAIWKSDEWFQQHSGGQDPAAIQAAEEQVEDQKILQEV
jgi:RNA recognition motif-containing protein